MLARNPPLVILIAPPAISAIGPPAPPALLPVRIPPPSIVTSPPLGAVAIATPAPAPLDCANAWIVLLRIATCESPRNAIWPPGPAPKLSPVMVLSLNAKLPARMKTLPPLPAFVRSLTSIVLLLVMLAGPKLVAVKAAICFGSTGTSPAPAALVTCTVPAGATKAPPATATGPPTRLIAWPAGTPSEAPLTVIFPSGAFRKPNAAGGAIVKEPASGLVAWNREPSDILI